MNDVLNGPVKGMGSGREGGGSHGPLLEKLDQLPDGGGGGMEGLGLM